MNQFRIIPLLILLFGVSCLLEFAECRPHEICYTWSSTDCPGEDRALGSTDVVLTYQYFCSQRSTNKTLIITRTSFDEESCYNLTYEDNNSGGCDNIMRVEFTLEQQEHGGGGCNCVQICIDRVCQRDSE